jgi:hypothetical protein
MVYCKDIHRKQGHDVIQFAFLGYTFRPRRSKDHYGRVFVNFTLAISRSSAKSIRQTIRSWRLQLKSDKSIEKWPAFSDRRHKDGSTITASFIHLPFTPSRAIWIDIQRGRR